MQRLTGLGIILRNSENWTIIKFHLGHICQLTLEENLEKYTFWEDKHGITFVWKETET